MISNFSFETPTEIWFGRGEARNAAPKIHGFGCSVLLVTGANKERAQWLRTDLGDLNCRVTEFVVACEPNIQVIQDGVAIAKSQSIDVVVAVGGGSAIDAGKAIAALAVTQSDLMDHLEVVGQGLPLNTAPLPYVTIPTTAGTGAEVTKNAVIDVPDQRRKVSLRDKLMFANLAIIDPSLTDLTPKHVTLACGLDAITQVIEPYLCKRHNPFTDALTLSAIETGIKALMRLMDVETPAARDQLCWTSLCGGIALANSGLGAVHGLAGPLGGLSGATHGNICGALLPSSLWMHKVLLNEGDTLLRLRRVEGIFSTVLNCETDIAFEAFSKWSRANGQKGLDELGVTAENIIQAATYALTSSSMKANPIALSIEQLDQMMEHAR